MENRVLFCDEAGKIKLFALVYLHDPLGIDALSEDEAREFYRSHHAVNSVESDITKAEIKRRLHVNLSQTLKYGAIPHSKIKNGDEDALIAFNICKDDAQSIARSIGAEFYLHGRTENGKTVITLYKARKANRRTYRESDVSDGIKYMDEAAAFFAKNGFSYDFCLNDYADICPDIADEKEYQMSINGNSTFMSRAGHRRRSFQRAKFS